MNTKNPLAGAIALLRQHNEWRRGAEIQQHSPQEIGEAIDLVIAAASECDALRRDLIASREARDAESLSFAEQIGANCDLRAECERLTRSEKEARQAEADVRQMLDTYVGVEQRAEKAEARREADAALRAIKLTCLTAPDGPKALVHIVRLCIDAGVTDHLAELTAPETTDGN